MPGKIEWAFSLLDKTSGPASTIEKKLELVEKRLKAIDKAAGEAKTDSVKDRLMFGRMQLEIQRDQLGMRKAEEASGAFVTKLHAGLAVASMIGSAVSKVASALWDGASATARLAYNFGAAGVEAASFKETNSLAFRTLLGSQDAADRVMASAVKFAAKTPFETADMMGFYKDLLTGGFKEREIPVVLKAAGDVAALNNFDKQVIDRLFLAFKQIKGKGRLQGQELLQLAEAGVPTGKVYERLGKIFNTTSDAAQKMLSKGEVSADAGIFAILSVLKDTTSGGQLGSLMDQVSDTVPGLLSTLKSKPFEFLMGLDKSAGFGAFKSSLRNLNAALDAESEAGQRIGRRVENTFNRLMTGLFGDFAGAEGAARAEQAVTKILDVVDRLIGAVQVGGALMKGFLGGVFDGLGLDKILGSDALTGELDTAKIEAMAQSFGKFGEALGLVVGWFTRLVGLAAEAEATFSSFGALGTSLFSTELERRGIEQQMSRIEAARNDGLAKIEAYRAARGIPSPTPGVTAATIAQTNQRATFAPQITVNAPGATKDDAKAIADKVDETTSRGLASFFESFALQGGG